MLGTTATPHAEAEELKENRKLLIDTCIEHNLILTNTQFRKQEISKGIYKKYEQSR